MAAMTTRHLHWLAGCALWLAAVQPLHAQACCDEPRPAASAAAAASAVSAAPCASCPCQPKPGGKPPPKPAPAPQVACASPVITLNVVNGADAVAPASAPSKPAEKKSDDKKGDGGDAIDGLPAGFNARAAALAVAGCFMLLGLVLLVLALIQTGQRQRGRILLQVPLTFGGRGYGWEASRPLGLLVSGGVCFLLAVLLLLQLLSGARGKAEPPKVEKPSVVAPASGAAGR
jgi:hypothetical protein